MARSNLALKDPVEELAAGLAGGGGVPASQDRFGPSDSVNNPNAWFIRSIGGGKTESGAYVSEWSAVTIPAVFAAVSIIADNCAQVPVNVYQLNRATGERKIVWDHPLQYLLHDEPNEDMTSYMFRQTTLHHALLWGNGYAEVERTRGGEPVALWPLLPDRTEPYKPWAGDSLVYRTTFDGKSQTLPKEDVVHLQGMGFDGYRGYSPITVNRNAIGMTLALEKFGGKFFANDSRSGGFLSHPGKLGGPAKKNIRDSMEDQGGPDNAFRVKVLEEGMKFIPTTIAPDDAQFLASREFQISEIARMFRVPLVLLQSMEKATSWGTGIEQMMIGYVVNTITPWVERFEQELKKKLLTTKEKQQGLYIKFNLNALMRGDMAARASFYTSLFNIASLNPNEIRAYEELNPYAAGERYYAPLAMGDPANPPAENPRAVAGNNGGPPIDDDTETEA